MVDLRTRVAACGRFHEDMSGVPLYTAQFDEVLPFHADGAGGVLAPVRFGEDAWHIRPNGTPAYAARYRRCFGFYEGRATAIDAGGWLHIDATGAPISRLRYAFAGNFQGGRAVVCDLDGHYLHIDPDGRHANLGRWLYCGDYREGVAVVQRADGLHGHVDLAGMPLHDRWFEDLDVFHKGFARARDEGGWYHIDRSGRAIYPARFAMVEAFYNGCARVERFDGALLVIDQDGKVLRELRGGRRSAFAELSADMVGYWKTFAIAAAVELGLPEALPGASAEIAAATGAGEDRMRVLVEALGELGLVTRDLEGRWTLTEKGAFLRREHRFSLAEAALEYSGPLLTPWQALPDILRGAAPSTDFFERVTKRQDHGRDHHRMLRSYALHDYAPLVPLLPISSGEVVFDAGGGDGALTFLMTEAYPEAEFIIGDLPGIASMRAAEGIQRVDFDFFSPWPIKADRIIFARVLHDWSDAHCVGILEAARAALHPDGEIYVIEMLRAADDFGGALCGLHLLANSGGKERTQDEYTALFARAGLRHKGALTAGGLVTALRVAL